LIGLVFELYPRLGDKKQRALKYVEDFTQTLKILEARREETSTTINTLGLDLLWNVSLWEKILPSRVQAEVAGIFLWLREIMFPTATEFRMLSQWGRPKPVVTVKRDDSDWDGVLFCVCKKAYNEADDNGTLVECTLCENWYHDGCVGLDSSVTPTDWLCPTCQKQQKTMVLLCAEQAEEVTVGRSVTFGGGGGGGKACNKTTNSEIKEQFLALLEMFSVTLVPLLVSFLGRDDYRKFLRLTTKFVETSARCKKVRCLTGFCSSLKI